MTLKQHHHEPLNSRNSYQTEVRKRVHERLAEFMNGPILATELVVRFREHDGFANGLSAEERDQYLSFGYSLNRQLRQALYFGLEDGTFMAHFGSFGTYREPADAGYNVGLPEVLATKYKYYRSCVDENGGAQLCTMEEGGSYIYCDENCSTQLLPCPDEVSQGCANESLLESSSNSACDDEESIKWCKPYEIRTAPALAERTLGFVPRTDHCSSETGQFSQKHGEVWKRSNDPTMDNTEFGDCLYLDESTFVNRSMSGDYGYCGGRGSFCNGTFLGGYRSRDYDPRYRGWYIATRASQSPMWSTPYVFFRDGSLGISYSEPIYSIHSSPSNASGSTPDKKVFAGVVAVDYKLENIAEFLQESFGNSTTTVAVFEEADPWYMIASSTGTPAVQKVLSDNNSLPCPDEDVADVKKCIQIRVKLVDYDDQPLDQLVAAALFKHQDAGFIPNQFLSVKGPRARVGDPVYISQTQLFQESHLKWRVIIYSPTELVENDTLTAGTPMFGMIVIISILGFLTSLVCLVVYYRHVSNDVLDSSNPPSALNYKKVVRVSPDWRLVIYFLAGCALFNTATLSLLGPNTDSLCMLRMWMHPLLLVVMLAPLLVHSWRMCWFSRPTKRAAQTSSCTTPTIPEESICLHSDIDLSRTVAELSERAEEMTKVYRPPISAAATFLFNLPFVLAQIIVLAVFTVVDPYKAGEIIDTTTGEHRIICTHSSRAFMFTKLVLDTTLLVTGCILAAVARGRRSSKRDNDSLESTILVFAAFNVAVIYLVVVVVSSVFGDGQAAQRLLYALGIFWATSFSALAFVLPFRLEENAHAS